MERVAPTCTTRSTSPMSMPSSRDAVATRARRDPALRRRSASRRRSFERLPWWLVTASSPRIRVSWAAMRSAILRVFTKTSVVRWPRNELGEPRVDLVPLLVRADGGRGATAAPRPAGRAYGRCPRPRAGRTGPPRPGRPPPLPMASGWRRGRGAGTAFRSGLPGAPGTTPGGRPACRGRGRGSRPRSRSVVVRQHRPPPGGREQQVERLRGRDQDVGRAPRHGRAVRRSACPRCARGRVARAIPDRGRGSPRAGPAGSSARRSTARAAARRRRPGSRRAVGPLAEKAVDRGQEAGQRLARSRGGGDEDVLSRPHERPALALGRGGLAEPALEPGLDSGMKGFGRHDPPS